MAVNDDLTKATEHKMRCARCGVDMAPDKTSFNYLTFSFSTELLRCPKCHQVFVPESLVKGRMAAAEAELEDK